MKPVEVRRLSVGYGHRAVIDGLDMEVCKGEFLCVVGPNGAGKTTLLKTILSLLKPLKGVVYVYGRDVRRYSRKELAKRVGAVLTERVDPGMLRVWEVVALGRYPRSRGLLKLSETDVKIVDECLRLVGAENLRDRYFLELSDGEKQKVLIARALAQEPQVLVLDEPTTFLDLKHRMEIVELLRRLCRDRGITVIATFHDISLALRACDRVVVISGGRIVAQGLPEDVLSENVMEQAYGLDRGRYDPLNGNVEPRFGPYPDRSVFVAAGYGRGVSIARMLKKMGLRVFMGIVLDLDVDYVYGMRTADRVVHVESPSKVDIETLEECRKLIESCFAVVDSGFPVNELYNHNVELLHYAYSMGIPVLCRRREAEIIVPCKPFESHQELRELISKLLP